MFKNYRKILKISSYFFCSIFLFFILFHFVFAITTKELKDTRFGLNPLATQIGFKTDSTPSFAQMLGQVVGMALSILGMIFLVLMIYGGFTWMTARGDNDKVTNAKNTLINATIGAIIVFSAYAISNYIITELAKAV